MNVLCYRNNGKEWLSIKLPYVLLLKMHNLNDFEFRGFSAS